MLGYFRLTETFDTFGQPFLSLVQYCVYYFCSIFTSCIRGRCYETKGLEQCVMQLVRLPEIKDFRLGALKEFNNRTCQGPTSLTELNQRQ